MLALGCVTSGWNSMKKRSTRNDIDDSVLSKLTAEDLISLGVTSVGHRRKLLAAIAALRAGSDPVDLPSKEAPAAVSGTPRAPEAERRQLTVMFATSSARRRSRRASTRRTSGR